MNSKMWGYLYDCSNSHFGPKFLCQAQEVSPFRLAPSPIGHRCRLEKRAGGHDENCWCDGKLVAESGIENRHLLTFHPLVTDGASRSDQSMMKGDGEVFFNCGAAS